MPRIAKNGARCRMKKAALQKKRAVIDTVFDEAYQALCGLDADARGAICKRLLTAEAEGGETIVPAAADRKQIETILPTLGKSGLKLSEQNAAFDGGFLLIGCGFEKDCSFRAVLSQLREEEETAVANLLFN